MAATSTSSITSSASSTTGHAPKREGGDLLATFRPPQGTAVLGMAFAVATIVMSLYWHSLTVMWKVMFSVFLLLG